MVNTRLNLMEKNDIDKTNLYWNLNKWVSLKADYIWLDENTMDDTSVQITKLDLYLSFAYPRVRCNLELVTSF